MSLEERLKQVDQDMAELVELTDLLLAGATAYDHEGKRELIEILKALNHYPSRWRFNSKGKSLVKGKRVHTPEHWKEP